MFLRLSLPFYYSFPSFLSFICFFFPFSICHYFLLSFFLLFFFNFSFCLSVLLFVFPSLRYSLYSSFILALYSFILSIGLSFYFPLFTVSTFLLFFFASFIFVLFYYFPISFFFSFSNRELSGHKVSFICSKLSIWIVKYNFSRTEPHQIHSIYEKPFPIRTLVYTTPRYGVP